MSKLYSRAASQPITSLSIAAAALCAAAAVPAWGVDWRFSETYDGLNTGDLISVDGVANPAKADTLHTTAAPPKTYEAQFGSTAGASTVITDLGGGNKVLDLTRDANGGTEAFTVLSTGQEANAPRGGMAAATVKFRIDSSTDNFGAANGFHISFYRNLIHGGTIDDGPWVNNIAALKFRNVTSSTVDLWADGYVSPFGGTPDADAFRSPITTLDLDTWYTAEVYLPAFNADNSLEHVDAQYRILDETGSSLLGYGAQESLHQTREITFTSFSTELTPEIVGIQTINTLDLDANWQVDDLRIGVGTGADIDAIFANPTAAAGSYHDYDFDGDVDGDDATFYVQSYLLTEIGDVDLDRDVDGDDLAIAQSNLNTAGGWSDGDVNGDGLVDAADIALIGGLPSLVGDYNADGFVSQGDLDLVLLNWGDTVVPAGFDEDNLDGGGPFDGLVSQNELDGVLLNWGDGTPPASATIPEPTSAVLIAVGGLLLTRRRVNS